MEFICPQCNGSGIERNLVKNPPSGSERVTLEYAEIVCRLCEGKKEVTEEVYKTFANQQAELRKLTLRIILVGSLAIFIFLIWLTSAHLLP